MKHALSYLVGACTLGLPLLLQPVSTPAQSLVFDRECITNPTPLIEGSFGSSLAPLGNDQVLIGAWHDNAGTNDTGAAYLFRLDGTRLVTFTNPVIAVGAGFGYSVAAFGNDRVLIGAPFDSSITNSSGQAYLFNTNGNLLTTFTNPLPNYADKFGQCLAAVGTDRILIGALEADLKAKNSGAAYLFDTNGNLLVTYTNPTPALGDLFGCSVAGLGPDRVLIGASHDGLGANYAGVAYLFDTTGTLITTFTNPAPVAYDWFGTAVAAMGPDRVLITAPGKNTGAKMAGEFYLYLTNGIRLSTFTNPAPADYDLFGKFPTPLGPDRVLIGKPGAGLSKNVSGTAYLFASNGTLLNTFTNPTPTNNQLFGFAVAAAAADQLLIGAPDVNTGHPSAGKFYLYSIIPSLTIQSAAPNTLQLSWPAPATGWVVQQNVAAQTPDSWNNAPGAIQDNGSRKTMVVTPTAPNQFYRLFKP